MTDTTPRLNRIAATNPAWAAVVDRDAGRCTCTGQCGKSHRATFARHTGEHDDNRRCTAVRATSPLLVAPRDPAIPVEVAVRLASTELRTWCDPCLKGATSRATSARKKARKQALQEANLSVW